MKLGIISALLLIALFANGDSLDGKLIQAGGFDVIGITVRTTNKAEMSTDGKIPAKRGEFFNKGILDKIPNKADNNITVLYYEYTNGKDGEYTYLIGAKVTSVKSVPEGMVSRNVPAGKYAVFTSERGPIAQVVQNIWKHIWEVPKDRPGGDRTFKVDYEIYEPVRAQDPQNSQTDVYVGIK
jgi:predicted transcriptional regulator YdeE